MLGYFERSFGDGSHRILEGFVKSEDYFLKIVLDFSVIWILDPNLPVVRVDRFSDLQCSNVFYIIVA